ncbi:hypothetical protein FHT86_005860 [Rhizobium sp. BK313]|nr:hypothetical protein [Rhizobium sp. BK313]
MRGLFLVSISMLEMVKKNANEIKRVVTFAV